MELKTNTVIVKVTNDCNINCRYCFVEKTVPRGGFITDEVLKRLFDELEEHSSAPAIRIIWHGGEPLLAGIEFFRKVVTMQKAYKKKYTNCIQTNGLLLTEDIAGFLKDNSFQVGVSLDGPRALNDAVRVDRSGNGTFENVFKNILLLKEQKVPFGILVAVSRHNAGKAKELYSFCRQYGLPFKVSSLYTSGNARDNIDLLAISPDEYAGFLEELAQVWMDDSSPVDIQTLESMLGNIIEHGRYQMICSFSSDCCESFLAVGPTGDLYPCCLFQGFEEYRYGNISRMSIAGICHTAVWKELKGRADYIDNKACPGCPIKEYCRGGCPFNAFTAYGSVMRKDHYCRTYKRVMPAILEIAGAKMKEVRDGRKERTGDKTKNQEHPGEFQCITARGDRKDSPAEEN
ncbi:MAG: radical SAM protein [Candidatus Omnitrophica bacterium]|nr:radical SAM protein [Candidatus Omnitrophota bacterium]